MPKHQGVTPKSKGLKNHLLGHFLDTFSELVLRAKVFRIHLQLVFLGGDLPSGEADKLSFGHFGFLSCLCQRLNESVCVLINDKRSNGIVKGLLESGLRCDAMDATRKEFVLGEGVHRPIVIRTELAPIDIGPGWDRPFERIKGILSIPAPTDL